MILEIRVRPSPNIPPDHLQAVEELAEHLQNAGHSVAVLEFPHESRHGDRAWPFAETIGIFIASGAAGALLNSAVSDLYNATKKWAKNLKKKEIETPNRSPKWERLGGIAIYGPDGKVLFRFLVDNYGNLLHSPEEEVQRNLDDHIPDSSTRE